MPSYSRKYRVPHDLAHLVTERELLLATGVFGSLAAGAMFSNARVVSGRPRHDAAARSKRILAANRRGLAALGAYGTVTARAVTETALLAASLVTTA